jgi:PAS domain S-box-containing protein
MTSDNSASRKQNTELRAQNAKLSADNATLNAEIAKLKAAHNQLNSEHEQLLGITNNLPGCVVFQIEIRGSETRFSYMGENAKEIFGYPPEMAKNDLMVAFGSLSRESFDQFMLRSNEAFANKGTLDWTGYADGADGKPQKRRIRSKYRQISEGVVVFDGYNEDVQDFSDCLSSHVAEAEESIAKRLMNAVEQANDSVMMTNSDGSIYYVNPAFSKMTGYDIQDLAMKTPRALKSGEQSEEFYEELWGTVSSGKPWSGRFVNRRKDGSLYLDETTITPVYSPEGEIANYIAIKRDITREVELERQLIRSQRREAIGTLAGGIAHDFNNILTAMLAFCVRAQERKADEDVVSFCLAKMKMAICRAANLVDQILAFSKSGDCEKKLINLSLPIEECIKLLQVSLPKNIKIKYEAFGEAIVLADETHIHQILMNLCTNACHAMGDGGGVLSVEVSRVDFSVNDANCPVELTPGVYCRLSIRDTGCGISPERLTNIFDPYYTTKRLGDGTGIGLSLVNKLVSDYCGIITVKSIEGEGSCFNVYLPQAAGICIKDDSLSVPASSLEGREHILLVDDETEIIEVLQPSLEDLGYKVTSCFNAEDAQSIFESRSDSFDILVTDQVLTGISGAELAGYLREIKSSLPVIICSGYSNVIDEQVAKNLGFNAFLKKPFDAFELAALIRSLHK